MKKKLMIAVPVLLLLLVAVGAKMTVLAPAAPDEAALAKEPGAVYTMSTPFTVNLADSGETPHFAKVGVALRFSKLSEAEIIPGKAGEPAEVEIDSELRDIVIATLQSKTTGQLSSPAGRADVKRQIVGKVNKQTDLTVLDVYYTEFAVQ